MGSYIQLVRYGVLHEVKPGLIDLDGRLHDLSGMLGDIGLGTRGPESVNAP